MNQIEALHHVMDEMLAPWVKELRLAVVEATDEAVILALPIGAPHVHSGGVYCGQSLMAAADTAMILAVSQRLGGFKPMTTVQLQSSFLRPIADGSGAARVVARVLRLGKTLVFGEVEIFDSQGRLACHSTTTYALL